VKKMAIGAMIALSTIAGAGIWRLRIQGDDEALLREANRHFAGFETKISLPTGQRVAATGPARDQIRLELFKQHLARKEKTQNPALYNEAREAFAKAGPMQVTLTVTDPVSGVETEKTYVESKGRACHLQPGVDEVRSVVDALRTHPCLRLDAEPTHSVKISAQTLEGEGFRFSFERHWRELVAIRHRGGV
jgi:hypothetical protein